MREELPDIIKEQEQDQEQEQEKEQDLEKEQEQEAMLTRGYIQLERRRWPGPCDTPPLWGRPC